MCKSLVRLGLARWTALKQEDKNILKSHEKEIQLKKKVYVDR